MYTVVMILRVWALYGRSRFILGIFLMPYITEITGYLVWCIKTSAQDGPIGTSNMALYHAN